MKATRKPDERFETFVSREIVSSRDATSRSERKEVTSRSVAEPKAAKPYTERRASRNLRARNHSSTFATRKT